jgi:putative hemolysin
MWPFFITILVICLTTLVLCEVLPKTLSVRRPEKWALRVARPVQLLQKLAGPLNRMAEGMNLWIIRHVVPNSIKPHGGITEEDYRELLEMAFQQGALEQSEHDIILHIIRLDRRTARDVMRPRSQMAAISDDLSIEDMVAAAKKHRHRRLPMYDENLDTIVGVLNTRALLLDPGIDLADAIEFPSFVPETMNLLLLLKSLQRQQRGMAIVLDEFGGTAGIVTLEDILEEIIGKIRTKTPSESLLLQKLGTGKWRVSGNLRLDDFRREHPQLQHYEGIDTMAGLFLYWHQVIPAPGESETIGNLKLTAEAADDRRIRELVVEVTKP